jgi:hypothetical protein
VERVERGFARLGLLDPQVPAFQKVSQDLSGGRVVVDDQGVEILQSFRQDRRRWLGAKADGQGQGKSAADARGARHGAGEGVQDSDADRGWCCKRSEEPEQGDRQCQQEAKPGEDLDPSISPAFANSHELPRSLMTG